MGKAEVLALLQEGEFISGEEISGKLGISRAAVWKAVNALRIEGCQIDAVPNRGYRLLCQELSSLRIQQELGDHPWHITVVNETDSTNNALKRSLEAPHGTVLIARRQTGGRGRLGRQFVSPTGGVYLSVLLRPKAQAAELFHLTAMTAVAIRRAIVDCCELPLGIKWTNDLVWKGKKIGGILTELSTEAGSGALESVIIGVGINCNTQIGNFPPEVEQMASSLAKELGKSVDPNALVAAIVRRLYEMDHILLTQRESWLKEYKEACITLGKWVQIVRGGVCYAAFAEGIDENGGLMVCRENGERETVNTGEVSVRGMYGYVPE